MSEQSHLTWRLGAPASSIADDTRGGKPFHEKREAGIRLAMEQGHANPLALWLAPAYKAVLEVSHECERKRRQTS